MLLDSLGFTIHPTKSCLVPTQILVNLRFVLNSVLMTVSLTQDNASHLVTQCEEMLALHSCSIRECAAVLGTLVAAEPGVDLHQFITNVLNMKKLDN